VAGRGAEGGDGVHGVGWDGGGGRSRGGCGKGGSEGIAGGEADDRRSRVVGVCWSSSRSKWRARPTVDAKRVCLGYHATEEAAAQAIAKYVEDGVDPVKRLDRTSQFKGVWWDKREGKWRATCKGISLGYHTTEEAAAQAYNNYVKDGVVPTTLRGRTSQFTGVCWDKRSKKWEAKCKGKHLGYHATEEAAAQAITNYVEDGVVPVTRRDCTSRFTGVSWDKICGKWRADCKGNHLGHHPTEQAAARACNIEAQRVGITDLNDIPPADNADDGGNIPDPAAHALPSPSHLRAGTPAWAPSALRPAPRRPSRQRRRG